MRGALRWILRILVVLILAIATVALWKREEITRLFAVNSLFAPEKIVANFSAMDKAFLTVTMDKGAGPISPLPNGPKMGPIDGLDDFITNRSLTALSFSRMVPSAMKAITKAPRPRIAGYLVPSPKAIFQH